MSKKHAKIVFYSILILLVMFACAPKQNLVQPEVVVEDQDLVLNWNVMYMPKSFYPQMNMDYAEKQILVNMYEGLTRVEEDMIQLGMASEILPSEDFMTYTVELKPSFWSDGLAVTSDDFIYSWERPSNYRNEVNLLYYDAFIEKVTIVDDKTFEIHLYHPNDHLLEQLSTVAFMPIRRDLVDLNREKPVFVPNISNGPYTLKSYSLYEGIVLCKNDYYYDANEVMIDAINIQLDTDFSSVYQSFQNGNIDFIQGVDHQQINNLMINEDHFKILDQPSIHTLVVNSNHEAFKDVRIRKLISMAIDRTEVNPLKDLIKDAIVFSVVDYEMIEKYADPNNEDQSYYPVNKSFVDLDRIDGVIVALGSGQLEELNGLRLITRDTPNDIRIAEMLVDGWHEYLGVKILIETKDRYDYEEAIINKDYDLILKQENYQEDNIRYTLKQYISETKLNQSTFASYTYDKMLLDHVDVSNENLYEIFRATTDELDNSSKLIPIYKVYKPIIISDAIQNWSRSYESLFYFGRANKTALDKEALIDESREVE
jgi:oligopeptide transport system substrate-binding protein